MEHARFFNETSVTAIKWETVGAIEVETARGTKGEVRIRAALLPPNFQSVNPQKGGKTNKRFEVMKEFNGLIVCRAGRQIDCIPPRWTKFQNMDANIKVEIDFDAELDEYFGITTAKQQIVIADDMWEKLQHAGKGGGDLINLVKALRHEQEELDKKLKAGANNAASEEPRPSETAMAATEKFKPAVPEPTTAQQQDASQNLEAEATALATLSGQPVEATRAQVEAKVKSRRWEVKFDAIPEGPFYRPKRVGVMKRLTINTDHPFFEKVYEPAGEEVRSALEVLLFTLAERELECRDEAEAFYKSERNLWSMRLRNALEQLASSDSFRDKASAVAETLYEEAPPVGQ